MPHQYTGFYYCMLTHIDHGYQALEMLLGTPNVFSVDQRTTVILHHKLRKEGASSDDIQRALVR